MDQQSGHPLHWRGFVSVTAGLSFVGVVVTGVVLFFIPAGRFANGNGWQFLTLAKQQWHGLHIWLSVVFVIATVAHMVYNWGCLMSYLKDKARVHLALRWEWGAALLLIWVVSAGTVTGMKPFSSFLDWHRTIKHGFPFQSGQIAPQEIESYPASLGEQGGNGRGSGRGFGQMTLTAYCEKIGLDPAKAKDLLEQAGLTARGDMTLRAIADAGQVHPSDIRRLLEI